MSELKDILLKYDNPDKKVFDYCNVETEIRQLPQNALLSIEVQSELLAMLFQDGSGKKDWGTYYGPIMSGTQTNKDTGEIEPIYNPDYKYITTAQFDYWFKRAGETLNPLMKMRYLGLIYDFQKKITGVNPDYHQVMVPYVESILNVVLKEYYQYDVIGCIYIERAFQCANALHNKNLLTKVKDAFLILSSRFKSDDDSPGLWGKCFQIMLEYHFVFLQEEINQIVKESEDRFIRIKNNAMTKGRSTDSYAHLLKEQAEVLCQYYLFKGDVDKIEITLSKVCDAIKLSACSRGKMWLHGMLSQMQALYRKYHLNKQANKLYVDIQASGAGVLEEMQEITIPFNIEPELIDNYVSKELSGSTEEIIHRYIVSSIPSIEHEKQRQLEESKKSAFLDMVPTTTYDIFGNPINNIGVGDNAKHQKFMYGMYTWMKMNAMIMRIIVNKMIDKKVFTYESVMQTFEGSIVLHKEQIPIFERGIKAYFDGDYIVTCHLLIPLFESAIRMLIASLGEEILQHDKDPKEGNRYVTLECMLENDKLKSIFPEDVLVYFKNLFTDHNGWNLRNLISHGLMSADGLNSSVADRVVHSFMVLSGVKESKK